MPSLATNPGSGFGMPHLGLRNRLIPLWFVCARLLSLNDLATLRAPRFRAVRKHQSGKSRNRKEQRFLSCRKGDGARHIRQPLAEKGSDPFLPDPKGTDFSKVSDDELARVVHWINNRPRKCLGYRTPYEVVLQAFSGALGK